VPGSVYTRLREKFGYPYPLAQGNRDRE
jgi:hypothetical protein